MAPSSPAESAGRFLFADRDQVAMLYQRGVQLGVRQAELHDPGADPVAADAANDAEQVRASLRRAWEWVSGHR